MGSEQASGGPRQVPVVFPTTLWTVVLGAREGAARELNALCETYHRPVEAYLRARGEPPHDAADLAQGFFQHLLRPGKLDRACPERGRFRAFLLTMLKNYVRDAVARQGAERRGGKAEHIDLETADRCGEGVRSTDLSPDAEYDRAWAESVVETATERLLEEARQMGREELVAGLLPFLYQDETRGRYSGLAERTGMSTGVLRRARARVLARFRSLIVAAVRQTLSEEDDLEQELSYLIQVLSDSSGGTAGSGR